MLTAACAGTTVPSEDVLERQPVLAGALVLLRPLREDDVEALYAVACDPLLGEQHPSSDRVQRDVFDRWFDAALASGGALTAVDQADGAVIGTSRYDRYDPARREVEIGWTFLARSHWSGAYNGEMKRLMLEHAFACVDAVVFRAHERNVRSQHAIEKLGAVRVGTEDDPSGRGQNDVFRLDRSTFEAAEHPLSRQSPAT